MSLSALYAATLGAISTGLGLANGSAASVIVGAAVIAAVTLYELARSEG